MDYKTVVPIFCSRFPSLEAIYRADFYYMQDKEASPYTVFGSILLPALTEALEQNEFGTIQPICAFLEEVSCGSRKDNDLAILMSVEVARWLGWAANEDRLAPWLGAETKRICNYVPGLATQRRELRSEKEAHTISTRIRAALERLRSSKQD